MKHMNISIAARGSIVQAKTTVTAEDPAFLTFGTNLASRRNAYIEFLRKFNEEEKSFNNLEQPVGNKEFLRRLVRENGRFTSMRRGRPRKELLHKSLLAIQLSTTSGFFFSMIIISLILFFAELTLITFSIICFKKRKKVIGWISVFIRMFLLAIGGALLFTYFVIAPGLFQMPNKYLQYQQHLSSPDKDHIFVLLHDYNGVGDPSWHVFRFSNNVDPKNVKIPAGYTNELTDEDKEWSSKMLMWNWSEAGDHMANPHIEIIKNRYLVFVRGDIYLGLYDIKADKTLIDDHSPWHTYIYSDEYKTIQPEPRMDEREKLLTAWTKKTLHQPIVDIIEANKN